MNMRTALQAHIAVLLLLAAGAFRVEGGEPSLSGHEPAIEETPLRGIAHVGIQVSDFDKSRAFYHDVLGFEEVFRLPASDRLGAAAACFKINDRQFIEVFPGLRPEQPAPIRYAGFWTDDIDKLHSTLARRGVAPAAIGKGPDGNLMFSIPKPTGLELDRLDFVQYTAGSLHTDALGKGLSDRRISASVNHLGLVAGDLEKGRKFCVETLGFRPGSVKKRQNGTVYAIHLDLPGGSGEFVELSARPSQFDRHQGGIKTHLCLTASDARAAYQQTVDRGATLTPVQTTRGKQEKFPFLLFDPDHSRIEFMAPK